MSLHTFDTLEQAENLHRSGFSEDQAKGLVQVIALSQTSLATKEDIQNLETHIKQELREEMRAGFSEVDKKFMQVDKQFMQIDKNMMRLENKILRMTISLGSVVVTALGVCTYLLK